MSFKSFACELEFGDVIRAWSEHGAVREVVRNSDTRVAIEFDDGYRVHVKADGVWTVEGEEF